MSVASHYTRAAGVATRGDKSVPDQAGLPGGLLPGGLSKHVMQHTQLEQSSRPKVSGQFNKCALDYERDPKDSYVLFLRNRGWVRGVGPGGDRSGGGRRDTAPAAAKFCGWRTRDRDAYGPHYTPVQISTS